MKNILVVTVCACSHAADVSLFFHDTESVGKNYHFSISTCETACATGAAANRYAALIGRRK